MKLNFTSIIVNIHYPLIEVLISEKLNLLSFLKSITVIIGANVANTNDQNSNAVDIQIGNISVGNNPPIKMLLSKV